MRKLCLILLLLTSTFSVSKSQIPKPVIDWCLAVNEQNKQLKAKVAAKDSVNQNLEELHTSDTTIIGSQKRQLLAAKKKEFAYRESGLAKDTIIMALNEDVKKANTRTWGVGLLGLGIIILIIVL